MVEIISVGADNIIGCIIKGKIESDDMVKLTSVTEDRLKNNKKLRVYVEIEDLGGISFDAFFKDLKLALKHYRDFERKAVVTNHKWIRKITPVLNRMFPGIEARCFPFDEKEKALDWIKQ